MAYKFGDYEESDETQAEEPRPTRTPGRYSNDFKNLNRENILGAAYAPNYFGRGSTSEKAKGNLRNLLSGGGYRFPKKKIVGGVDKDAILRGEEPE